MNSTQVNGRITSLALVAAIVALCAAALFLVTWQSADAQTPMQCEANADHVISANQGNRKNGSDVTAVRSNPANALGSPSNNAFYTLGFSGSIVLHFDNTILNGTGADVRIYEASIAQNYPLERARVEARMTETGSWVQIGFADNSDNCNCAQNTTDLDLGSLTSAHYIRITDVTNPAPHSPTADGFDLNAVQALHTSCQATSSSSTSSSVSSISSSRSSTGSSVSSISSSLSSSSLSSSRSSTGSSISSSSLSSSAASAIAGQPSCNGIPATIYVGSNNRIVGGRDDGEIYRGSLRGTRGNDVIVGTNGEDRVHARSGNDIICGRGGADDLDGGLGNDSIAGEEGSDELDGGNGSDLLCGNNGNDELDAGNGEDQLDGGAGTDELDGGNKVDVCRNGEDIDDCESSGAGNLAQCTALVSTPTSSISSISSSSVSSSVSSSSVSSSSLSSSLSSSSLSSSSLSSSLSSSSLSSSSLSSLSSTGSLSSSSLSSAT
jgi:Ca2+-binding RTX toxin-like protein